MFSYLYNNCFRVWRTTDNTRIYFLEYRLTIYIFDWFCLALWYLAPLSTIYSYIVAVSVIGGSCKSNYHVRSRPRRPLINIWLQNDNDCILFTYYCNSISILTNTIQLPNMIYISDDVRLTVTRRVSLVKQYLLTLLNHLMSPPVISEVRVAWSLDTRYNEKRLKIPKGLSQVVIRRRTHNTMTIGKSTKEQTMNYEYYTQKTTDYERNEPH